MLKPDQSFIKCVIKKSRVSLSHGFVLLSLNKLQSGICRTLSPISVGDMILMTSSLSSLVGGCVILFERITISVDFWPVFSTLFIPVWTKHSNLPRRWVQTERIENRCLIASDGTPYNRCIMASDGGPFTSFGDNLGSGHYPDICINEHWFQ